MRSSYSQPARSASTGAITLAEAHSGLTYRVVAIRGKGCRENLLRIGMSEGATVECVTNIKRGPVMLRYGRTDIAVGRGMANRILVSPVIATGRGGLRRGMSRSQ